MARTPDAQHVLNDLVILDANHHSDLRSAVLEDQLAELRAERQMLQDLAERRAIPDPAAPQRPSAPAPQLSSSGSPWWRRVIEILLVASPAAGRR